MRKFSKNQKGFTLAEEIVTVVLIGVLIVMASGILMNAMRIFCRNVITLTAQEKGIAVMEQLERNLEYATDIKSVENAKISSFNTAESAEPYQVILELGVDPNGKNILRSNALVRYSSIEKDESESDIKKNTLCRMGTYTASYEIKAVGDKSDPSAPTSYIIVDLKIQKNGTTYYSDNRIIELKNKTVASNFSYNSSKPLYISCLE